MKQTFSYYTDYPESNQLNVCTEHVLFGPVYVYLNYIMS